MRRVLLLASASAALLASTATADTVAETPTAAQAAPQAVVAPADAALDAARIERLQRAELAARMDAVIEASKKAVAGLQTMIDVTTDPTTLRELEGRMAQVKFGTTIDLLRVQAKFARENGRIAQADAIDTEIEEMLNPKTRVPASAATSAARRDAVGGAR